MESHALLTTLMGKVAKIMMPTKAANISNNDTVHSEFSQSLQDYLKSMNPLQKGKVRQILDKKFRASTGIKSRAEIIEQAIANGCTLGSYSVLVNITQNKLSDMQIEANTLRRTITSMQHGNERENLTFALTALCKKINEGFYYQAKDALVFQDGTYKDLTLIEKKYAIYLIQLRKDITN